MSHSVKFLTNFGRKGCFVETSVKFFVDIDSVERSALFLKFHEKKGIVIGFIRVEANVSGLVDGEVIIELHLRRLFFEIFPVNFHFL